MKTKWRMTAGADRKTRVGAVTGARQRHLLRGLGGSLLDLIWRKLVTVMLTSVCCLFLSSLVVCRPASAVEDDRRGGDCGQPSVQKFF